MHTAIRAEVVLEPCPLKVASLAAWGDKCVLGTQCGSLLVLGQVPSPPPNQHVLRFEVCPGGPPATLASTHWTAETPTVGTQRRVGYTVHRVL